MEISTLGIDLSKTTFHVIGFDARGEIVLRRKFSRKQLLQFTSNRQQILIGMEACGGAHFLGRALQAQGHDARLMPAQFVKPFRKSNKNDYLDAEAIAEADHRWRSRGALRLSPACRLFGSSGHTWLQDTLSLSVSRLSSTVPLR
ncbi:transposase [Acidipila rosea]|uniref:Transposase n=1 Tax=Acidipila rosea TaxID=768535 RepID=A0A4R1L366_9BACT|nr:transposase [Acidipila rosea]TCK72462.1 transposase [Acidipila rosea]